MDLFEFNPEKSQANKEKHGVDLGWARRLWSETHVVIPAQSVAGERRFVILAMVGKKCYAAVFTKRGETVRIITCHRADRRLEGLYESYFQD